MPGMINRQKNKGISRMRRSRRVRAKVRGTAERPRLSVFRSDRHIYAQLIDDERGATLAESSDQSLEKAELAAAVKGSGVRKAKVAIANAIGRDIAGKAKEKGVSLVVFDRNGFAYTGRVAALADGAREGGLIF